MGADSNARAAAAVDHGKIAALSPIPYTRWVTGDSRRSPLYWGLAGGCLGWLTLVVTAPLGAAREWDGSGVLYWLFHSICHQLPERSFHVLGEPFAACHRCTGLYLGFTLGVAVWPSLIGLGDRLLARPRWILLFFVPLAVDVAIVSNTAPTRFLTGLVAAFPAALFCLVALAQLGERRVGSLTPGEL
ncbi:MAG: DUF2085 domain-containing protein [Acidobacteriota bacterium]|nr:DUF2085 domain-containing protein [Acidobacteriota bacterium]